MNGLFWTIAVWGVVFAVVGRLQRRHTALAEWLSRDHIALVLALLGTYSLASRTDAAEVLREPVVMERIVRGGFALGALVLVVPALVRGLRGYARGHRALTGLVIYIGIAGISTLYSAAPVVTAAKVMELTAGLAPVAAITLGERPARRLRSALVMVLTLTAAQVTTAVAGFFVLPSVFTRFESRPGFVFAETMVSPYAHNNSLSAMGALVGVVALAGGLSGRLPRRVALAGTLVGYLAIVLASGRQGVAMALAGTAVVLWAQRRTLFLTLLGPALAVAGYVFREDLYQALSRNRPSNFTTLTGRVYWWEAALEAWNAHPWTGWGYAAGGRFVALASVGRGRTSSVHSGYVEALVGVGILGVIPLVYTMVSVGLWSLRRLRTESALAVLIVMLTLRTAVGPGFGGWLNLEFVVFALLAGIADRDRIDTRHGSQVVDEANRQSVLV